MRIYMKTIIFPIYVVWRRGSETTVRSSRPFKWNSIRTFTFPWEKVTWEGYLRSYEVRLACSCGISEVNFTNAHLHTYENRCVFKPRMNFNIVPETWSCTCIDRVQNCEMRLVLKSNFVGRLVNGCMEIFSLHSMTNEELGSKDVPQKEAPSVDDCTSFAN